MDGIEQFGRTSAWRVIASATLVLAAAAAHADEVILSTARAGLISQGWHPRETFGALADGRRWSRFADAGALYDAGFVEVQGCSGTSPEFCIFNYERLGKCVTLHTSGQFKADVSEPVVVWRDERCPPTAITVRPAGATAGR